MKYSKTRITNNAQSLGSENNSSATGLYIFQITPYLITIIVSYLAGANEQPGWYVPLKRF